MTELYIKKASEYIDVWAKEYFENSEYSGVAISILKDDEIVYNNNIGYANIESKEELTSGHLFRFASHSKSITAVAIMQLVEQDKLKLDDKIVDYLDFLNKEDEFYKNITIRQIMSHMAGITRDTEDASFWFYQKDFLTEDNLKSYYKTSNSVAENNISYNYSNIGYGLLGLLIEEITGISYNDYVKTNIFDKIGLKHSAMDYDKALGNYVYGHTSKYFTGKQEIIRSSVKTNALSSATGLVSTTQDMVKIYNAIHKCQLINKESKKEIFKITNKVFNNKSYSLGFELYDVENENIIGHSGGFPGQLTITLIQESTNTVVSIAINNSFCASFSIIESIYNILNFFKNNKDNLNDISKVYDVQVSLFSTIIINSIKGKLYLTSVSANPFNNTDYLKHIEYNSYEIINENKHDSKKSVKLFFNNQDKLDKTDYIGHMMYNKKYFVDKILPSLK